MNNCLNITKCNDYSQTPKVFYLKSRNTSCKIKTSNVTQFQLCFIVEKVRKGVCFGSQSSKEKPAPTLTLPRGEGRRRACKIKTRCKQDKTRRTPRAWCVSTHSERKRTGLPVQPWKQTPNHPKCPQGHRKQPRVFSFFSFFSFSFFAIEKRKKSKKE